MGNSTSRRQPHARYCILLLPLAVIAVFFSRTSVDSGRVIAPQVGSEQHPSQLDLRREREESDAAMDQPAGIPGAEAGDAAVRAATAPGSTVGAPTPMPSSTEKDEAYARRRYAQQHPESAEDIDALWLNVHDVRRNGEWWAANPHTQHDAATRALLAELGRCTTVRCASLKAKRLHGTTRFNFPHYFLIGWQKCATTSVYAYLRKHPQTLFGRMKETHWFTSCRRQHFACKADNETHYLQDTLRIREAAEGGLDQVTADASADYARAGTELAPQLLELFPWLKIVVMLREPISRAISYTRMHTEREHWDRGCRPEVSLYDCLMRVLAPGIPKRHVYGNQLAAWLTTFPKGQVHVIQMEAMQDHPEPTLNAMKDFLGMDVAVPAWNMRNVNSRHASRGQPMKRGEYLHLVNLARNDARRVARVLDEYGAGDGAAFVARWETVWQGVLDACEGDQCYVDSN